MNKHTPFTIQGIPASPDLKDRILLAIEKRQYLERLWRIRLFTVTAALSVAVLVPVMVSLVTDIRSSSFGVYLSLFFSDGGLVSVIWKEVAIALMESLPALTIMSVVLLSATFLWSLRKIVFFMKSSTIKNYGY